MQSQTKDQYTKEELDKLKELGAKTPDQYCCDKDYQVYFYQFVFALGEEDYCRFLRVKMNIHYYLDWKRGIKKSEAN